MIRLHMLEAERQGLEAHVDFDIYRDRSPSSVTGPGQGIERDDRSSTPTTSMMQDDTVHHTHHHHQVAFMTCFLDISYVHSSVYTHQSIVL